MKDAEIEILEVPAGSICHIDAEVAGMNIEGPATVVVIKNKKPGTFECTGQNDIVTSSLATIS